MILQLTFLYANVLFINAIFINLSSRLISGEGSQTHSPSIRYTIPCNTYHTLIPTFIVDD